eukprot:symbB.v1.2.003195.t1/scaffold158.1/size292703/8
MFLFSDVTFSGWPTAIWHGFLSAGMFQAWFPMHAEVWNAPTWFLSALTFAMAALPFALPVLAKQSKAQLQRTGLVLFFVGLLPKLGYCYDHQAWGLLEGAMSPKAMPNLAIFNVQRFNPFYALIEVLLGAVACRMVMLDGAEGEEKAPKTNVLSTALPLLGMAGCFVASLSPPKNIPSKSGCQLIGSTMREVESLVPTSPLLAPRLNKTVLGSQPLPSSPPMSWVPAMASTAASSCDPVNASSLTLEEVAMAAAADTRARIRFTTDGTVGLCAGRTHGGPHVFMAVAAFTPSHAVTCLTNEGNIQSYNRGNPAETPGRFAT